MSYVPLAVHAVPLSAPGRLSAELAGVDVPRAARRHGLTQVVLLVPLVVRLAGLAQALTDRPCARGRAG